MKKFNFLSKSSSRSCGHNVVTLASTVGSQEEFYVSGGNSRGAFTPADVCQTSLVRLNRFTAHRRGTTLKHMTFVLLFLFALGVGNAWAMNSNYTIGAQVTSLVDGEYVAWGTSNTNLCYTIENDWGKMNSTKSGWIVFKVVKSNNAYYLQNTADNNYVYSSAAKKLAWHATNKTAITLSSTSGRTSVVYNSTTGHYVFNNTGIRPYTSLQNSYGNAYLYKVNAFSVTYNANGGSGSVPTDNGNYLSGATVTVKTNSGNLAKDGYTFAGWNTKDDGTGTDYAASGSATFSISASTILYAKWESSSANPTISTAVNPASSGTVVIKDDGNNTIASGSEFSEGDEFTLTATPNSGYKFAYWSLSTGSDAILNNADENPTSIMMIEESTTVNANFAQPATVADASNISCTGASFAVSNSAGRNNFIVYTTSGTDTPTSLTSTWTSAKNGNGTITISSLTKNTTYYYWCASEVASGHYVYTDKKNFTTANNFDLNLTLSDGKGNTASAPSYTCIASGTSVTLTASPTTGYVVSGWTVLDGSSNEITPTSTTANTFTFNMPSSNVTAEAIFQQQVVAPTFTPAAGTYGSAQSVTISTTTPSATIYYTIGTNPADPTTGSTPYTSAISVSSNQTIKAIAVKDGMANSAVSTAAYTIKCATPEISLTAGTYTGAQTVTISGPTGATIYYTTNGSTPTTSSSVYSEALTVSSSQTIKAIAVKDGMANSEVASAVYTIQYTITWNDNGGQIGDAVLVNSGSTTYTCPADPSPATRGNCGDRFMGWTDANYSGDEAPTVLFTNSSGTKPAINGNKNFRAVFADYAN